MYGATLAHFLERFFGDGNDISYHDVISRDNVSAECARQWIEDFPTTGQLVLPRRQGDGVWWYGLGATPRAARSLREALLAFAGPTLSTFRGLTAELRHDDPVEMAVTEQMAVGAGVYRLEPAQDTEGRRRLAEALLRMRRVGREAEQRDPRRTQDTWHLLERFKLALSAGDYGESAAALTELRRLRRLDAVNTEFLNVRLLAEMGDWEGILQLPGLRDIVNARRTTAVTRVLITAVYRTELVRFEERGDATGASEHFRERIWPEFGPLYESRRGLTDPDVIKSFMLAAVSDVPPRRTSTDDLLAVSGLSPDDTRWLRALRELSPDAGEAPLPEDPDTTVARAREALNRREYDDAVRVLGGLPPSVPVVACLLECAYELQTGEITLTVRKAYERLAPSAQAELKRSRRYSHLVSELGLDASLTATRVPPTGWFDWLERCLEPDADPNRLRGWAAFGADEWSLEATAQDASSVHAMEALLEHVSGHSAASQALATALPDLLTSIQNDPLFPRRSLAGVYRHLAELLSLLWEGRATPAAMKAYAALCAGLLEVGVAGDVYADLMDGSELLWGDGSPRLLPGALDVLDVFATYPCPQESAGRLLALAQLLLSASVPMWRNGRLDAMTWSVAQIIAADFDLEDMLSGVGESGPAAEPSPSNSLAALGGIIGLYTLTERVAVRVREMIGRVAPDCTVVVNSDRVETEALRDLATRADVFVMVIRSAKHAATDCIRRLRAGKPLLCPDGRGASSIMRALAEHVTED